MNQPYRLTPIHNWHLQHGARFGSVLGWKQVLDYRDPQAEVASIASSVGISDATSLTKIEVQGTLSSAMLEQRIGKVPEIGTCLSARNVPSGEWSTYIARLTEQRFMILDSPEQGVRLGDSLRDARGDGTCVHVTDVTSAYAVLQLAGPKSTDLLKKFCSLPVDRIASDHCNQCPVVGVRTVVIRRDIGTVPCWMLLVARDVGEYAWETVISAGREFKIRPYGIAAERALRMAESTNVSVV